MSRHRNVRNLNLDEEYDEAYDDTVYGRSVDEHEHGVSPAAEQYLYSRARRDNLGNYFEGGIDEEDYDNYYGQEVQEVYQKPKLTDEDEARLQSVLDHLRGILADSVDDEEMVQAVLENDFDAEKSLDKLLKKSSEPSGAEAAYFDDYVVQPSKNKGKQKKEVQSADKNSLAKTGLKLQTSSKSNKSQQAAAPSSRRGKAGQSGASTSNGVSTPKGSNAGASTCSASVSTPKPVKLPTKQRDSKVDVEAQWKALTSGESKELINLVVVGHVDAGKSTLTGHLLYIQGNVTKKAMHKYEQQSKKSGKQSMYAWVMDDTEEERARGITVDIAERSFETPSRVVNILDAPGHKDFIPNMISGAARAEVALLVVDSSIGEFEAGFESNGQTREHAMLIKSLGVSEVAVAVNKLDTVQWSQERYNEIKSTLTSFLKTVGYKSSDVIYIPCSGLTGQNLTDPPTESDLSAWYDGPTILQAIDNMKPPTRDISCPSRYSISDVFKGGSSNMCVTGKLHTGYIQSGDKLILMPHTVPATVKDILSIGGTSGRLFAGNSATLTLSGLDPDMLQVGNFLCDPASLMKQVTRLQARIVVFNIAMPIIKGTQLDFHHQAMCEPATIRKLVSQINKTTGEVTKQNPRFLAKQMAGVVEVQLNKPVCVETYKDNKELGRFMLRQQGNTVAAGLITEIKSNGKILQAANEQSL